MKNFEFDTIAVKIIAASTNQAISRVSRTPPQLKAYSFTVIDRNDISSRSLPQKLKLAISEVRHTQSFRSAETVQHCMHYDTLMQLLIHWHRCVAKGLVNLNVAVPSFFLLIEYTSITQ